MASGLDIANRAKAEMSEIGGKSGNHNKYTIWFNQNCWDCGYSYYWCAVFVTYVARMCGIGKSIVPDYSYCPDCISWARKNKRLYSKSQVVSGSYKPQVGDIFLREGHTGIIVSVSSSGFTTVEGNTDGAGPGNRTVGSHTWTFSGGNYDYIFNPDYPNKAQTISATSKKQYTDFPKYTLSESMIRFIAGVIVGECSGSVLGCRQEASQMVNLNEYHGRTHDDAGMKKTVKRFSEGGWYADKSFNAQPTQTAIDAVRFVMVEGKRVLPRYVVEHDWFPNDIINAKSRSSYKLGDTVKNNSKSTYQFYCFFDGRDGDIAGYFQDYYEKYKSDVPWTEGADAAVEGYMYSENAYADEKEPEVVWNNRVKENIHPRFESLTPLIPNGELTIYVEDKDITNIVGNLSWQNSIYELATTMSFETAKSDAKYLTDLIYVPAVGDIVRMVTNEEVFRGVIIKVDDGDENSNKYSVVDLGWYLNKTSQTYQFTNISASDAIKQICDDLSIEIAMLPELTTSIKQIYFDKTISDILTDILEQCDGEYSYDLTPEGLRIYKIGDLVAYPEFRIAENIPQAYSPDYKGSVTHSVSIEEMKDSIKVTSEKDNVYTELMVLQNRDLINKYGFLQEVIKIDPEKQNAEAVASSELLLHGRENETFSFEIIEKYDSYTRAGEVIFIDEIKYVIESTQHSFKNGYHFNKLELHKT